MNAYEKVTKYGLWATGDGSVEIPKNSPFWDLKPAAAFRVLQEARSAAIHVNALDTARYLILRCWDKRNNGQGRDLKKHKYRMALAAMPNNPFASAEEKFQAAELLRIGINFIHKRLASREASRRPRVRKIREMWGTKRRVVERDCGMCRYCGNEVGHSFHLDHVIPEAYGGSTTDDNLVVACITCNLKKGGRTPAEAGMTLLPVPESTAP